MMESSCLSVSLLLTAFDEIIIITDYFTGSSVSECLIGFQLEFKNLMQIRCQNKQ